MSLADDIRKGNLKKKKLQPLDLTSESKAKLEQIKQQREQPQQVQQRVQAILNTPQTKNKYGMSLIGNLTQQNNQDKLQAKRRENAFINKDFNTIRAVQPQTTNRQSKKNNNIWQDIVSLTKLTSRGGILGGKQTMNYIESSNENNFNNYASNRRKQFYASPNVNELAKSAARFESSGVNNRLNDTAINNIAKLPNVLDVTLNKENKEEAKQNIYNQINEYRNINGKIETNLVKKGIRDSINRDEQLIQEEQQKLSNKVTKRLGEIAPSMGQMIPGTALSAVNPVLGTSYFITSAGGEYLNDALNRGMNDKQAYKYATIMAGLEGGSEAFITGQQVNKVLKSFGGKQISKNVLNSYGFNIFENAVQEAVMEPAQEITAGIVGDKADWTDMGSRIFNAGFNGALMGGISNGVTYGLTKSGNVYNKIQNGEKVSPKEYAEALKENINKFGKNKVEQAIKQGAVETYQEIEKVSHQNETAQPQSETMQNLKEKIDNSNLSEETKQSMVEDIDKGINQEEYNQMRELIDMNEENQQNTQMPMKEKANLPTQEQVKNYQYEKSDNVKVDNLRKDANKFFDNSEKTHNFVNMLEKIIQDKDIDIRLDENLTDSEGNFANGKYENGVITINPNSDRAGEFIAIHELTHAIGTDSMRNIIENYRKSNADFDNAVKSLLENYNATELTDEAMADVSAQLLGNQEYINNLAQTNPSMFRKIYNEIKYLWHQFTGYKNQNQFLEDLQYKWEQAYRNNNKLNDTTNYHISKNFNTEIDKSLKGEISSNNQIKARDYTPKILVNNGVQDLPMLLTQKHLRQIIYTQQEAENLGYKINKKDHYHGLGKETLIKAIDNMDNPSEIYKQSDKKYLIITEQKDSNNNPIIVPIEINGTGTYNDVRILENQISTVYGHKKLNKYLSDNNFTKIYEKNRSKENGEGVKSHDSISASNNSIPQNNENVNNNTTKYSMKESENNSGSISMDNQGRQITKQQQEYFKNEAPIGLDNKGNLKVFYHKTGSKFNIIDFNQNAQGVFWFTDNKQALESGEVSANGVRPGQQAEIKEFYVKMENPAGWEEYDKYTIEQLKAKGYDSVAFEDDGTIIGFVFNNSNQIKNVDNLNPTDNPDIRYSKDNQNWQEYLEDNYKTEGTKTKFKDIRLPTNQTNLPVNNINRVQFDNDNTVAEGNKMSDANVAKILTETQGKPKDKRSMAAFLKANLIDKGMVFEEFSRKAEKQTKTKNELQAKWDSSLLAESKGQNAIGNARYEFNNTEGEKPKQISKSLTDIIDEVGENTEDFYNYMYHQLNIDRMTLEDRFGGDTGINYERRYKIENKPVFGDSVTAKMSEEQVKQLEQKYPEFKEYAQDVYDFLDANLKELVDTGVISKATQQRFKEMYPHYVPLDRVTDKGAAINVPLDTKRTGVNTPIRRATGGSSNILPLFETMANRTLQTYRASARNSFGVELKNVLDSMSQLNQAVNEADIDTIMDNLTVEEQNNELLQEGKNGMNPTFTVFDNGQKVTYEISNDMYDALKPKNDLLKRINESKPSKYAVKFNNFRRGLLTEYNPVFTITNAVKDAQDVLINSQHPAKTYSKVTEATAQILSKGHWFQEYIQNGGEQNSYFKDGEFETKKTTVPSKIKNVATFPLRAISGVNNVIEMTPRLSEYIASRESGRSIQQSMLDASRVTTNFKAGGDFTKTLNRNGFTFLNASVQGMQQQIRNIQEANAKGLKGYAVLATKYAIAGAPALILNNLLWGDDDDYEDLQDYVKDNYYCIAKLPNGTFLRIPKGRMVATIQKVVSNAEDFVKDGKINADDVGKVFWGDLKEDVDLAISNLAPNNPLENNLLSPIFQAKNNKTWYGEDLVPSRLKDKPSKEQYDESTDKLSRWLGEKTGISPMKINYLLDQYSGGVGDVLLPMGTPQAENNVLEDKFTTDPVMKSKYPGEFFNKIDELKVSSNSDNATDEDRLKYQYMSGIQGELSDLYKKKREIQNSTKTDKEKKEQLKKVQTEINKLAKKGLENFENIKISGNTAKIKDSEFYKTDGKWKKLSNKEKERMGNISLKSYADYKNKVSNLSDDEYKDRAKKLEILKDAKYTKKEKKELYSNFLGQSDEFFEKAVKNSNVDIEEYIDYKIQWSKGTLKADRDANGKAISGTAKKKVYNYINNNITGYENRLLLLGYSYKLSNNERRDLADYINQKASSNEEATEVFKKLYKNYEYRNGKIYYK